MKKTVLLSLVLSLCVSVFAQSPILVQDPTVTPPTPMLSNYLMQGGDGTISVGTSTPGSGQHCIFRATNDAVYPSGNTPYIISAVTNLVTSTNWPTGNTPYSFAVTRVPIDPDGPDGPVDLVVDGYGHTGVGILDPVAKLHLFNAQDGPLATLPHSFQVTRRAVHFMGTGPGYTFVNYDDFMVSADGLVGIGVATPTAHLDIADQTDDGQPLLNVMRYSSTDPPLHITATGVVGIGRVPATGSGAALLQVNGSATINGNAIVANDIYVDYDANITGDAHITGDAEMDNLYVHESSYMTGNVAIQQSMSVARYVQIGSTSPLASGFTPTMYDPSTGLGFSLYVKGGILAESYKCAIHTSSDWMDRVFDKSYTLKPLSEVETYIAANHHLPDVPSADEVVCNGVDMAKMDATLLQKIEELTLYTIELKKEIELLKSKK